MLRGLLWVPERRRRRRCRIGSRRRRVRGDGADSSGLRRVEVGVRRSCRMSEGRGRPGRGYAFPTSGARTLWCFDLRDEGQEVRKWDVVELLILAA
jgi:hypothetical protein